MSGLIAIEGELNNAIQEYLEYIGFEGTLEKFNEECFSKGKSIASVERRQKNNQKTNLILNEMIQLFCHGERKEFFRRWLQNIPSNFIQNIDAQKLEFELNIYFAVYPLRKSGKDALSQYEDSIASFKTFIETRGRALSQNTEYLPFFALPYVPNPEDNAGYKRIFSEDWNIELQRKLEEYLAESLKVHQQPRLVDAYCNPGGSKGSINNLQQQLLSSEKRTMGYMKKFNKVQADYHNLIGITAELVDSLENTIRGQPVTSEYLQNICNRLFNSQLKQSIDFTRPGTAGEYIRQSLAYQKSNLEKEKFSFPPLDFVKLKHDLMTVDDRQKALLLQALRWRLTKSPPGEQREKILDTYIMNDLLTIKLYNDKQSIMQLLKSNDEAVKQYVARILNAFASLNKGRSYLASNTGLIKIMEEAIREEKDDTLCRQNLLAALQKLSLRRNLQTLMINDDIIKWLLSLLEDTEELSDYTLEYAVALLMNLCLRSSGKVKCTQDYKKAIKVLSDLLGNSNHEIRPYVNGALYSILSMPSIRAYAKKIDLEDTLKTYLNDGNAEINTQIQFIINQINSNETAPLTETDSENEDNDDDEEDQDAMETDLDKTEIIKANTSEELIGENLLITYAASYTANNVNVKVNKQRPGIEVSESVLNRPTTPHQLRQSLHSFNQIKNTNSNNENERPTSEKSVKMPNTNNSDISKMKSAKNQRGDSFETKVDSQNKQKNGTLSKSAVRPLTDNKKPYHSSKLNTEKSSLLFEKSSINSIPENEKSNKKVQNSIDNSKVTASNSIANNASSFVPKFSSFEPRPSSANSSKSRNSSEHSGTATISEYTSRKDNSKS